ncbi:MAG: trypsin-like peptidase domain-containing protein [Deltaproteobacteria bacterium]|nr:trypsin-like peptidase domain-containing protein [Deltaproteobacteria bacterium]
MRDLRSRIIVSVSLPLAMACQTTFAARPDSSPSAVLPETESSVFEQVAEKLLPSVVNISARSTVKSSLLQGDPIFKHFLEEFFGGEEGSGSALGKAVALGSGFIIDDKGTILTNNHVVSEAEEIKVAFTEAQGEPPADAKVVGRDPDLDVALIRLKHPAKNKLVPVQFGDSDRVRVGQLVMAFGNPFGQGHSATHGIISQKERPAPGIPLATYLQTDAPINPGNSGGPLVSMGGTVIGINNAIVAQAHGIGFAIPINVVKSVLPQLQKSGTVTRGYIGVAVENLTPDIAQKFGAPHDLRAPFVVQVTKNSPAGKVGVEPYDVITRFAEKEVRSASDLIAAVSAAQIGKESILKVLREGREKTFQLTPQPKPVPKELAETKPRAPASGARALSRTGMKVSDLTRGIASEIGAPGSMKGVAVTSVLPGGVADAAGLEPGDVIVEVDREKVASSKELSAKLANDSLYVLRVRRSNETGDDQYFIAQLDLRRPS